MRNLLPLPTYSYVNYLCIVLLSLACSFGRKSYAQDVLSAGKAYDHLQNLRKQADAIIGESEQPHPDSLHKAQHILKEALSYYHQPLVQMLAKGDIALLSKKGDILYDLALIQIKAGQKEAASQVLVELLKGKNASLYVPYLRQETQFAPILQEAVLVERLAQLDALQKIFSSHALRTPYKPNISEEEKMAGLSKFWSEAKYNFAFFDQVPSLDWDKLYLQYIPKVAATTSTLQYLKVMQEFCAHLQDGHTNVWGQAEELVNLEAGRPPFRTFLVENSVLIGEVFSDSLSKTGIRPGVELTHIDGLAVHAYAAKYITPYQSGSTPQNIAVATYTYNLLKGPKDKSLSLTFRDAKGKTFGRELPRSGYRNLKWPASFRFEVLPGNIAYVQLNDFESEASKKGFVAAFDSIASAKALILDLRLNGGGDSSYGWDILGYLTDSSFQTGAYTSRLYSPLRRARGEGVVYESLGEGTWPAHGKKSFTKPVVVLTSGRTFSAAEDFVVAFDAMKRGKLIGETTGGSTGQPLVFDLPGGLKARICTKRDTYPDGKEWIGKGVAPDILVKPTLKAVQAGKDLVLEAALQELASVRRKNEKISTGR